MYKGDMFMRKNNLFCRLYNRLTDLFEKLGEVGTRKMNRVKTPAPDYFINLERKEPLKNSHWLI